MRKPILCLDFDGVIHSYESGWKGAGVIPDPPVSGALEFIAAALSEFRVAIYSSRSGQPGGIAAMQQWLAKWFNETGGHVTDGWMIVYEIDWPTEKPPALVTIDDRAICFTGTFPALEEIRNFKPWNKQ